MNYILVTRSHEGNGRYRQQGRVCRSRNGSVMGSSVQVRDEALKNMPETRETVTFDAASGTYKSLATSSSGGIRPTREGYTAPFPESIEASTQAPFSSLIYDMDQDGQPGVAMHATGLSSGTLTGIQRKQFSLNGKPLSKDRIMGLAVMEKETLVLSSTSRVISAGRYKRAVSSEDRTDSFFEEIRIPEGSTCDTVRRMSDDGSFLQESPF